MVQTKSMLVLLFYPLFMIILFWKIYGVGNLESFSHLGFSIRTFDVSSLAMWSQKLVVIVQVEYVII